MKNSPFQLSHSDNYKLANTTHELLKFQLQEQARPDSGLELYVLSLLMDGFDNSSFHAEKSPKDDAETHSDDSFDDSDISGVSTPLSDISSSWKDAADKDPRSYLNLKVLIENSVFDTSKMSQKAVLPLHKVKKLKQQISDKQEQKDYLTERITVSSQFCSTLLSNSETSEGDLDPQLLLKILKQTVNLQLELMTVTQDLEGLINRLNSHNMACLVLGYVEDLKLSTLASRSPLSESLSRPESSASEPLQAIDVIFSHVASVAAQKSVQLPDCPSGTEQESIQSKIIWTTQCIDALAGQSSHPSTTASSEPTDPSLDNSMVRDHSFLSSSPYSAYKNNSQESKTLSEYKLALNDLRFSHQYFMKEYEYLKENSMKTILEYRRKNGALEKEVSQLKNGSSLSLSSSSSRDLLETKDKEIAQLRREVNSYKIECMGSKSPRNSTIGANSPELNDMESSLAYKSLAPSMSSAILRKEFKKIVAEMQDQYEIELSEERFKRRDLEEKIQKLEIQ